MTASSYIALPRDPYYPRAWAKVPTLEEMFAYCGCAATAERLCAIMVARFEVTK